MVGSQQTVLNNFIHHSAPIITFPCSSLVHTLVDTISIVREPRLELAKLAGSNIQDP